MLRLQTEAPILRRFRRHLRIQLHIQTGTV
jgi:hypothetical protein